MKALIKKYIELPRGVKASLWFLVCSFLQKGISILTTPIFTRIMTTGEYGQYNVFNSWLGIVTVFVSLSMFNGVYTQGLVKFEDKKNVFSSSLQGMTLCLVLAWTVIYLLFKDFWNSIFSLTTIQMLLMLLMIWTTSVFSFWAAEQRVELRYKQLVIITLIVSVLNPIVSILLVCNCTDKVTARIFGLAIVEFLGYSWMFISQLKKGKLFFNWNFWKYSFLFSVPLIPHYLAQNILVSSDRIMIERMIGDGEAGIYSLAYSIAQIMLLFNTALTQTISPWIFRKIKDKEVSKISNIAYASLTMIAVANILLIALAPEAVRIFAPSEYYEAIWVIPPVAMSVYFQFAYSYFANFEFYYEKTGFITIATIASAGLNVILNYICIKQFGYVAAGYTTLFCYIVQFLCHYVFMQKICNKYLDGVVVYRPKIMIAITGLFLIIGFVFMLTYNQLLLRYALIAVAIILIILKRDLIIKFVKTILNNKSSD